MHSFQQSSIYPNHQKEQLGKQYIQNVLITNSVLSTHPNSSSNITQKQQSNPFQRSISTNHPKHIMELIYVPFRRIYIFDFDDTIFPTTFVKKNELIWKHTTKENIHSYKQCSMLYDTIKECVNFIINLYSKLILKYGANNINIVIITNATKEWIKDCQNDTYSSLIGSLLIQLENTIAIISARDAFIRTYDDWYSECSSLAKCDSIKEYILNIKQNGGFIPIIYSIGDGNAEWNGSKNAICELYEQENNEKEYILNRIKLKSNKKTKNLKLKYLNSFKQTLKNIEPYLFQNDDELRDRLKMFNDDRHIPDTEENEEEEEEEENNEKEDDEEYEFEEDEDDEDEDELLYIIDHIL